MSFVERFIKGGLFGLAFALGWFAVEGLYLALQSASAPVWSAPFNVGVAAPLVLGAGLAAAAIFAGWSLYLDAFEPARLLVQRASAWLWRGSARQHARRSAWLLALPLLLAVWFGVGVVTGEAVLSTVKTTAFAVLLIAGVLLVAALALALIAPLLVLPLEALLGWLGRFVPGGALAPAYTLAVLGASGCLVVVALWFALPDVIPHLPWHFVASLLAGCAAVAGTYKLIERWPGHVRWLASASAGLTILLGLGTAYMPVSLAKARGVFVGQTSVASAWYGVLDKKLDYDDDGALHVFAGNDCAPHDPKISPTQSEIISNGIDENCSGADLSIDLADFEEGTSSHPQPEGIAKKPHIILVTTDALSHGHTNMAGYKRDTTPELAKWAERATVFENGFALAPSTRLAMPGLLAGMFNSMMPLKKTRIHPFPWKRETPSLASKLTERGYRTVFLPGDKLFVPKTWRGLAHGFDEVDTKPMRTAKDKGHTAPELTERAIELIREHKGKKPLFLWVHYFDHHAPYEVPKGHEVFEGNERVDRFDNELRWTDKYWGELFDAIAQTYEPEEYVLAFTSDHGEAFDARHKKHHHGYTLDTPVLHVPFVIQAAKGRGKRVDGLVSHADMPVTLANLAGIEADEDWIGESLVPVLFDDKPVQKDVVFGLFYLPEDRKRSQDPFRKLSMRTLDFAYIEDRRKGHRRLLDWKKDPVGLDNLADEKPEMLEMYRYVTAQKLEWLRENERALRLRKKGKEKNRKVRKGRKEKKLRKGN
ncbi:sulfatase-like hydrolase/transferase [Persicimonas caeni]|nr:sulfatase-like hydrolase/transferase [Persicimonas caeni]